MQRYLLHTRTSRRPQNCFIMGLLNEENVPVASREQLVGLLPGSESDARRMAMQGEIEEFRELADALRNAWPHGQGPQHSLRAELQFAPPGFLEKALHVGVRSAGEEKQLVEIAQTRELGFTLRQARVLRQLTRRARAQRNHGHAGLFGQTFQGP